MRNCLTRIRLPDALFNLGQEYQPLHGVFVRRIIRQTLNRLNYLLLDRHTEMISARHSKFKGKKKMGLFAFFGQFQKRLFQGPALAAAADFVGEAFGQEAAVVEDADAGGQVFGQGELMG